VKGFSIFERCLILANIAIGAGLMVAEGSIWRAYKSYPKNGV